MTHLIVKYLLPVKFPFEYGTLDSLSDMNIQWIPGDNDKGENLSLTSITDLPDIISTVIFYKRGWLGVDEKPFGSNITVQEPNILIAKLKNGVFVYILTTTDGTGYSCNYNNFFEVRFSHDLLALYKFGISLKVLKQYGIQYVDPNDFENVYPSNNS